MHDLPHEGELVDRLVRQLADEPLHARLAVHGHRVREEVRDPREEGLLVTGKVPRRFGVSRKREKQ